MLVAMLLVGLLLSWLVQRANYNREQRRQVERIWRIGGAVLFEQGTVYELPVFPDEWQVEASKGWLHDALSNPRPIDIIFVNHTGIKQKTSDEDLPELIDAVRKMPTVKRIMLTRMFHSEAGAAQVKRAFPDLQVRLDLISMPQLTTELPQTSP